MFVLGVMLRFSHAHIKIIKVKVTYLLVMFTGFVTQCVKVIVFSLYLFNPLPILIIFYTSVYHEMMLCYPYPHVPIPKVKVIYVLVIFT